MSTSPVHRRHRAAGVLGSRRRSICCGAPRIRRRATDRCRRPGLDHRARTGCSTASTRPPGRSSPGDDRHSGQPLPHAVGRRRPPPRASGGSRRRFSPRRPAPATTTTTTHADLDDHHDTPNTPRAGSGGGGSPAGWVAVGSGPGRRCAAAARCLLRRRRRRRPLAAHCSGPGGLGVLTSARRRAGADARLRLRPSRRARGQRDDSSTSSTVPTPATTSETDTMTAITLISGRCIGSHSPTSSNMSSTFVVLVRPAGLLQAGGRRGGGARASPRSR